MKYFGGVLGTSLVWEVKRTKQIVPISPGGGGGVGGWWPQATSVMNATQPGFSVCSLHSVRTCQLSVPVSCDVLATHGFFPLLVFELLILGKSCACDCLRFSGFFMWTPLELKPD